MTEKLYHKALGSKQELLDTRKKAFSKGIKTGFVCLDEIHSFVPNYTTILYSPPHVGKSVITLDILMSLAERGHSVAIYSPEFRKKEELFHSLVQTRLQKCFFGKHADSISDEEYISAMEFIDQMFVVLTKPKRNKNNTQPKMDLRTIFSTVREAELELDMDFDFLFLDPWNYVDKGPDDKFLDAQEYVLQSNDILAEFSERLGLHTLVSAHTRDMELSVDKDTNVKYYPVGHPSQIHMGQSWFRAAYGILHYWRAPEGVVNPKTGVPYPANYNIIYNQKAKPFGSGRLSNTEDARQDVEGLFFDPDTYTMYEVYQGRKFYRNQLYEFLNPTKDNPQSALKPSISFDDSEDDIF